MVVRAICFLLVISAAAATYHSDLTVCPKEADARRLVGNETLYIAAKYMTTIIKFFRLPKTGMYSRDLNCLEVIDLSGTNSSGTVELVEGGLGVRFAEFKFTSGKGLALNYIVQVYTE